MNTQKRLAAQILKCSPKRVWLDPSRREEIIEAITKSDIRNLIKDHAIKELRVTSISRGRSKHIKIQKSKGRRQGAGSRRGAQTAGHPRKRVWINKIRAQRTLLSSLKEKKALNNANFRDLYMKAKGGFFRSKRHVLLYIKEHDLIIK